jgi:hypothetical protein
MINGLQKSYLDNNMTHSEVIANITSSNGYDNMLTANPNIVFSSYNNGGQSVSHHGFILAPNNCAYSIPADDTQVLKYNVTTDEFSKFGSTNSTSSKFYGGCYSKLTGKIYLMPYILTKLYKIDPQYDTVTLINFGSIGGFYTTLVEAENGMLYALPRDANDSVLEFNPLIEEWRLIPVTHPNGGWVKGIMGDDGCIYGVPYTSTAGFCKFCTRTFKLELIANSVNLSASLPKYSGAVLAPNKKIYCIPYYQDIIEVLDTVSYEVTRVKYNGTLSAEWWGACLGLNGKIYCTPYGADNVLEIDPTTNTAKEIKPTTVEAWAGSARNSGALLLPTGNILMAPRTNNWPIFINFNNNVPITTCLNRHINFQ